MNLPTQFMSFIFRNSWLNWLRLWGFCCFLRLSTPPSDLSQVYPVHPLWVLWDFSSSFGLVLRWWLDPWFLIVPISVWELSAFRTFSRLFLGTDLGWTLDYSRLKGKIRNVPDTGWHWHFPRHNRHLFANRGPLNWSSPSPIWVLFFFSYRL